MEPKMMVLFSFYIIKMAKLLRTTGYIANTVIFSLLNQETNAMIDVTPFYLAFNPRYTFYTEKKKKKTKTGNENGEKKIERGKKINAVERKK